MADTASLRADVEREVEDVDEVWREIVDLFNRYSDAIGEERLILEAQIERRGERFRPILEELIQSIVDLEAGGGSAPEARTRATEWMSEARTLLRDELQAVQDEQSALRIQRASMARAEMLPLERRVSQSGTEVDALLESLFRVGTYRASFGLLAQRLEAAEGEEERTVRAELVVLSERLRSSTTGLGAIIDLMDQREIEAAQYKQLLITSTGQITTDVLDVNVAVALLREGWQSMVTWTLTRGPQLLMSFLLFVVILVVFRILARMAGRLAEAAVARTNPNVPQLLKSMGVSLTSNAVLLIGVLIALSQLGFHVGPLLAGLGVVGFIMGFALQDTLSNFAAGMMILVYQPFDVGDVVEAGGVGGKVSQMSLVSTTVLTFDNQKLIVPNREIWGNVIRNKTTEAIRRVDLEVSVGERADVPRAIELLRRILDGHELVLEDPEPSIHVNELGDSSTELIVRPWVNTEDYWTVFWGVSRLMNDELEAAGISRPFSINEFRVSGEGAHPFKNEPPTAPT